MSIENRVFNLLHSSGVLCEGIGGNLRFYRKTHKSSDTFPYPAYNLSLNCDLYDCSDYP